MIYIFHYCLQKLTQIGFNAFLVVAATVFNVVLYITPDNNKLLSLIQMIFNILQFLIMVLFYLVFRIYNYHVQQTNADILQKSTKALQFVGQMFPENLREQLFNHNNNNNVAQHNESTISSSNHKSQTAALANAVDNKINKNNDMPVDIESAMVHRSSTDTTTTLTTTDATNNNSGLVGNNDDYTPIAELYPETTVMLADLAGFTAWSAVHEPSEVFMLLETIFYEFDVLASKRNIFKVETVGDCYVAVAGVPEPRPDHGVVMARFARECMMRFQSIVQQLEVRFGPGTSELGMRIGLNSGPITGGVLRGERSRFQLFGDTINTAARMESNSCKGRIQVSETTAQLLFNANKHHWLIKRDDEIEAKGKGTLQTYWLDINANNGSMIGSAVGGGDNISKPVVSEESSV
jgi:class 3 adenylate cyclase